MKVLGTLDTYEVGWFVSYPGALCHWFCLVRPTMRPVRHQYDDRDHGTARQLT
jgi:hypothetical protein